MGAHRAPARLGCLVPIPAPAARLASQAHSLFLVGLAIVAWRIAILTGRGNQ